VYLCIGAIMQNLRLEHTAKILENQNMIAYGKISTKSINAIIHMCIGALIHWGIIQLVNSVLVHWCIGVLINMCIDALLILYIWLFVLYT